MIVLITGPSGAGKSSFIAELMAVDSRLAFSVSTTTRSRRQGEVDGTDYDFVDDATFDRLVTDSAFVVFESEESKGLGAFGFSDGTPCDPETDEGRSVDLEVQLNSAVFAGSETVETRSHRPGS